LVAYDPDTARDFFSCIMTAAVKCIPQGNGDLRDRLVGISHRLSDPGYRKLIVLQVTHPFSIGMLSGVQSHGWMRFDVVLGPCDDGGYYLTGLRFCAPTLFAGISWSTSQVMDRTIRRRISRKRFSP
jgi:hypothetical protein